jgi:hypothetical protein
MNRLFISHDNDNNRRFDNRKKIEELGVAK